MKGKRVKVAKPQGGDMKKTPVMKPAGSAKAREKRLDGKKL